MPIKTFRGLLEDGAQERIRLETLDGKTGYRINKFQIMNEEAGAAANEMESTVKVYSIEQAVIDAIVNFSEQTLLGAAQLGTHASFGTYPQSTIIIFDGIVFNQDIFVTHKNLHGDLSPCNYYLELEQISLDDVEATAVILKNFRNTNTV